ncbi:tautomerase family protein [Amycolatopsis sp. ATCC 39116]|uniref:tautomerase family protein n=1 Tax=Amycolatopsis sp. (strain ATCC 39116 / 75iv2) TaxID=385957 RepID=UPI00026259D8|nr:tautomerase family protein [Amycolatopsis sp. ATCC 39116]
MPLIQVSLREGRDPERIRALITALTEATVAALDAPKESVRVIVTEVPGSRWAAGDVTLDEKDA